MKHSDSTAAYRSSFSINEDNRVAGFDPLRFLKMTANGPKLALDTKKVWFRLKYPEGRIILRPLNITEQMALIEARVFLHKTDPDPTFVSTVQKMLNEVPGGLYVQAAQHDAVEQVLDEAGFTIQSKNAPVTNTVREQPTVKESVAKTTAPAVIKTIPAQEITQPSAKKVDESIASQPIASEVKIEKTVAAQPVTVEPAVDTIVPDVVDKQINSTENVIDAATSEATPDVSAATEKLTVETVSAESNETETPTVEHHAQILDATIPVADESTDEAVTDAVPYTMSTPVDEICEKMSLKDALDYVITTGSCKGWTMSQAIARRPASVKFYLTPGYKGEDNILRASAKLVLAETERLMAS